MAKKAFSPSSFSSSSVQALYDLCKKTFTPSGASPASPQAIQKLCSLLGTIFLFRLFCFFIEFSLSSFGVIPKSEGILHVGFFNFVMLIIGLVR